MDFCKVEMKNFEDGRAWENLHQKRYLQKSHLGGYSVLRRRSLMWQSIRKMKRIQMRHQHEHTHIKKSQPCSYLQVLHWVIPGLPFVSQLSEIQIVSKIMVKKNKGLLGRDLFICTKWLILMGLQSILIQQHGYIYQKRRSKLCEK